MENEVAQIREMLGQMEERVDRMEEEALKDRKIMNPMKEESLKDRKRMDQMEEDLLNNTEIGQVEKNLHQDKKMNHEIDHNNGKLNPKCMVCYSREDRISELHETILLHILSYLPTKDSVCTSVLAKRWRYLWKTVPSLNFKFTLLSHNHEKFLDFADKVLMLRDGSAISEFRLSYADYWTRTNSFALRFELWMKVIARLKPKSLDLKIKVPWGLLQLPTMETLEMLKLRVSLMHTQTLHHQSLLGFHHLKILKLGTVEICLGELSNLPILEELYLSRCSFSDGSESYISLPSLRVLSILDHSRTNGDPKISASRLESLFLKNTHSFVFDRLFSLSKLVIVDDYSFYPICVDRLSKIVTSTSIKEFFSRCTSYSSWSELMNVYMHVW